MPAISDRDHTNADVPGLFNGDLHGFGDHDNSQTAVRVDGGGGGRLADDLPIGSRVEGAGVVLSSRINDKTTRLFWLSPAVSRLCRVLPA